MNDINLKNMTKEQLADLKKQIEELEKKPKVRKFLKYFSGIFQLPGERNDKATDRRNDWGTITEQTYTYEFTEEMLVKIIRAYIESPLSPASFLEQYLSSEFE